MKTDHGNVYKYFFDDQLLYIGSTFNLQDRERHHKSCLNNKNSKKYNKPFYKYLNENGLKIEDLKKEIINTTLSTKKELQKFEGILIRQLEPKCNKYINGRTMKEYREDNKEQIKEKRKEYRLNNKEKIKEYNKEYNEDNKEYNKEYHKEYRLNNKEKIKEYQLNNKEKISETRKNNRVSCIKCKIEIRVDCLDKHYKNIHS